MRCFGWLLATALLFGSVWAYEHPVKDVMITSFFGDTRGDHFHTGVDYRGPGFLVYPINTMKVLFYHENSRDPKMAKLGLGNSVMLEDQYHIMAYYAHLGGVMPQKYDKPFLTTDESVGVIGNTGHSFGNHLHILVMDVISGKIISITNLVNDLNSKTPPRIDSFFTVINNVVYSFRKKESNLYYMKPIDLYTVSRGFHDLYIDGKKNVIMTNLRKVVLFVDDVPYTTLDFTVLAKAKDKDLLALETGQDVKSIYGNRYNYKLGSFTPSKRFHVFRLEIEDWSGNSASETYVINFYK